MKTFKNAYHSGNESYLYLISTLKSSAVLNGATRHAFSKQDYLPNLIRGIRLIDTYISGQKSATLIGLSYKLDIITASGDEPWQARLAIRCPSGWSPSRFKAISLDRWNRSPWIAYTDIAEITRGKKMCLAFFEGGWDGQFGPNASRLGISIRP